MLKRLIKKWAEENNSHKYGFQSAIASAFWKHMGEQNRQIQAHIYWVC